MFKDQRNVLGILLILYGVYLVLEQFGIIPPTARGVIMAGLFIVGAVALFVHYAGQPSRWWAAMVAFFLSGLAVSALLGVYVPDLSERLSGPIFLASMSLGFASVFIINRDMWWAVIPAGVMLSLALVAYLDSVPGELPIEPGGLLFVGLGITFLLLALLKGFRWGVYPGIPLLIFGAAIALGNEESWSIIGPMLLVAGGAWLLYSSLRKKN